MQLLIKIAGLSLSLSSVASTIIQGVNNANGVTTDGAVAIATGGDATLNNRIAHANNNPAEILAIENGLPVLQRRMFIVQSGQKTDNSRVEQGINNFPQGGPVFVPAAQPVFVNGGGGGIGLLNFNVQ
jgi:hypothetical protein